jgi:hypothetical protein
MKTTHGLVLFWMLAVTLTWSGLARADTGTDAASSARSFVSTFYDWYLPMALKQSRAWDIALQQKSADFDSKLSYALREDSAAQDKDHGYIVGIDF